MDNLTPTPLNESQEMMIKDWSEDKRLWPSTDSGAVEHNLRIFARAILANGDESAADGLQPTPPPPTGPNGEILERTGKFRRPKKDEWLLWGNGKPRKAAADYNHNREILRLVSTQVNCCVC